MLYSMLAPALIARDNVQRFRTRKIGFMLALFAVLGCTFGDIPGRAQTAPEIKFNVEGTAHASVGGIVLALAHVRDTAFGFGTVTVDSAPAEAVLKYESQSNSRYLVLLKWIPRTAGIYVLRFTGRLPDGQTQTKEITVTVAENPEKGEWQPVPIPGNPKIYSVLTQGPALYAITNSSGTFTPTFNSVLRSFDEGRTWQTIGNGLPTDAPGLLGFVSSGHTLYLSTTSGIYRSTNRGENWANISVNKGLLDDGKNFTTIAAKGNRIFAAAGQYNIFLSIDKGENWTEVTGSLPVALGPGTMGFFSAQVNSLTVSENRLVLNLYRGLPILSPIQYTSIDNGATWQLAQTNLIADTFWIGSKVYSTSQTNFPFDDLFESADGGATYTVIPSPPFPEVFQDNSYLTGFWPSDHALVGSRSESGLHVSRDHGATWYPINLGLKNLDVENHTRGIRFLQMTGIRCQVFLIVNGSLYSFDLRERQ